ncbi:MAG: 3'-5' exonuclease [Actinomycetota bacterium]
MADVLRRRGGRGRLSVSAAAYDRPIDAPSPVSAPLTYGLDIETDTTTNGLDPAVAAVVAVAVTGADLEVVLDGPEVEILLALDDLLRSLHPGVLVTWNGSGFDLPFLSDRARRHGVGLGLDLRLDAAIGGRHDPLPGHEGAYRARWHGHGHLDGYQLFRADVGASLHLPCGLKPLARLVGLPVVEVDRSRIHELDAAARRAYVASDAHLARALVMRRAQWRVAVDQMPASSGS